MRRLAVSIPLLTIASLLCFATVADAAIIVKPPNNFGLLGYWSLNEGMGTSVGDSSGGGHTGTFVNSPAWVDGKRGKALDFVSASQQRVVVSGLLGSPSVATLSAWVNLDGGSPHATAVAIGNYVTLHARSFGDIEGAYYRGGSQWNYMRAGGDIAGTGWRHIVYVADPSNSDQRLYLDGVLIASDTLSDAIVWSGLHPNTTIGDNSDPILEYFLDGRVDEVRIYNRPLTTAQIMELYRASAGSFAHNGSTLVSGEALSRGLVGHWTMDGMDVTDKVYDKSGNGSDGYFYNGATSSARVPGKIGQAFYAVGANNAGVHVGAGSSLDITGDITISAWIKPTSYGPSNRGRIFDKNDPNAAVGYGMFIDNQNIAAGLGFGGDNFNMPGTNWVNSNPNVIALNTWQHVAVTYTPTGLATFYVNGVQSGSTVIPDAPNASPAIPAAIGRRNFDTGRNFDGAIDDVRVYNRMLTAAEIKQLSSLGTQKVNTPSQTMTQGTTLNSGLEMHYTFDGKDIGAYVYDRSGSGGPNNNFVIFNAATSSMVTFGKIGQALSFDGVNDRVLNHSTSVSLGTVHSTSLWINFTDTGDGVVLGTSAGDYQFYLDQTDVYYNASGAFVSVPHGGMQGWVHLGVVRNNTSVTFYKNGQQLGSVQTLGGNNPSGISSIGSYQNGTFPMRGKLDDIWVYTRAISAAEMKQLYNLGK